MISVSPHFYLVFFILFGDRMEKEKMGLILPQEVEVIWNGTSRQYYRDKGYSCDTYGKSIVVNVLDLSHSSSVKVAVKCDFCKRVEYISWKGYLKLQGDKYCCPECLKHKKKVRDKNGNLIFIDVSYRDKDWLYNEYIIPLTFFIFLLIFRDSL